MLTHIGQAADFLRRDAVLIQWRKPDASHRSTPRGGSLPKRALITGITGQDGSYLAELLLAKGYEVHGLKRRSSSFNTGRLDDVYEDWHETDSRIFLHFADMSDSSSLWHVLYVVRPDEIYNLAAQSHV